MRYARACSQLELIQFFRVRGVGGGREGVAEREGEREREREREGERERERKRESTLVGVRESERERETACARFWGGVVCLNLS
jgi:hypothetical protein